MSCAAQSPSPTPTGSVAIRSPVTKAVLCRAASERHRTATMAAAPDRAHTHHANVGTACMPIHAAPFPRGPIGHPALVSCVSHRPTPTPTGTDANRNAIDTVTLTQPCYPVPVAEAHRG